MNKALMSLLLSCGLVAHTVIAEDGKPSCAVLTFDAGEGMTVGEAKFISDRFAAFFGQADIYELVARSRMQEILKIAEFNRMDHCSATDCAVEAGRILQVRYMIFGSVGHVGQLYSLNSSLVEVETGRIISSAITDHIGKVTQFVESAPSKNIKALLKMTTTPTQWTHISSTSYDTTMPYRSRPVPEPPQRIEYPQEPSYIGPRFGLSMLTGVVGVEAQFEQLALDLGISPGSGPTLALKYYFRPYVSSWYVAIGRYVENEPSAEVNGDWQYTVVGVCAGYRWRSRGAWDFTFGLGVGSEEEEFSTHTNSGTTPYGEVAFGYSY